MKPESPPEAPLQAQSPVDKPHYRFLVPLRRGQVSFLKFALVGSSGVIVDMAILALLADPRMLGLNITLSKVAGAEVALLNNFVLNDRWTFGEGSEHSKRSSDDPLQGALNTAQATSRTSAPRGLLARCVLFHAICGTGIAIAVVLLQLFHVGLGWNLYLSNLVSIIAVALWNYFLNAKFTWRALS